MAANGGCIGLPGGKVGPGETLATAMRREINEELCLFDKHGRRLAVQSLPTKAMGTLHSGNFAITLFEIVAPDGATATSSETEAHRTTGLLYYLKCHCQTDINDPQLHPIQPPRYCDF